MTGKVPPIGQVPWRGRIRLLREALTYVKPSKNESFRYRDILYFARYLLPLRRVVAASILLTLLSSVLATALPLSGKWIIDYIFLKKDVGPVMDSLRNHHMGFIAPLVGLVSQSLPHLLLTLVLISLARYFISSELSLLNYRINAEYGFRVRMEVMSRVLRYPLSYFKSTRSGYLLARIQNDTGNLSNISSSFLQDILSSAMNLAVSSSILVGISRPLTLFVILSVPFTVALSFLIVRFNRSYAIRMRESGLQLSADGQEMIGAIDLIKIHSAEDRAVARYEKAYRENVTLHMANMLFGRITSGTQQAMTQAVRLGVMLYGGSLVLDGRISIGDYTAFLAMYPQLTGSITNYLQLPLSLQGSAISSSRVRSLLEQATEFEHEDHARQLIVPECRARGHIRCDKLYFSYEEGTPVLQDVSLEIHPGERIGLIGATGTGKTTFIHLLLKFFRPQSGRIYLDGHCYADLNPGWIREQIGLVSQELLLFNDTVFNNILYSRPGSSDAEVFQAARAAGIDEEIRALSQGYATVVGERGSKLSGGQKQRIAIARAFLRESPIIILDEPTAHLDLATDKRLMEEFVKRCHGRTTLLVTHRESLLALADRVFEVREGRLIPRQDLNRTGGG